MRKNWIVQCTHCGCGTTISKKPRDMENPCFVQCVKCNKEIDARRGSYRYTPRVYERHEIDLLKI